jgi:hypothetical protein
MEVFSLTIGLFSPKEQEFLDTLPNSHVGSFPFKSEYDKRQTKSRITKKMRSEAIPFLANHLYDWELIALSRYASEDYNLKQADFDRLRSEIGELTPTLANFLVSWLPDEKIVPFIYGMLTKEPLNTSLDSIMNIKQVLLGLESYFNRIEFDDDELDGARTKITESLEEINRRLEKRAPVVRYVLRREKKEPEADSVNEMPMTIFDIPTDLLDEYNWLWREFDNPYCLVEPSIISERRQHHGDREVLYFLNWSIPNSIMYQCALAYKNKENGSNGYITTKEVVEKTIKEIEKMAVGRQKEYGTTPKGIIEDLKRFTHKSEWGGSSLGHVTRRVNELVERGLIEKNGARFRLTKKGYRLVRTSGLPLMSGIMLGQTTFESPRMVKYIEENGGGDSVGKRNELAAEYLRKLSSKNLGPDYKVVGLTGLKMKEIYAAAKREEKQD